MDKTSRKKVTLEGENEENKVEEGDNRLPNANSNVWDLKVIINFVISGIFIVFGFYKMLAYTNEEYGDNNVNTYVGGDAYNYIINGNYTTAFFVLALIFTVLGCTFLISNVLQKGANSEK